MLHALAPEPGKQLPQQPAKRKTRLLAQIALSSCYCAAPESMRLPAAVLAILATIAGAHGKSPDTSTQPAFPQSYEAVYTRTYPNGARWQPSGVFQRVHVTRDHRQGLARQQFGQTVQVYGKRNSYTVSPQTDHLVCLATENGKGQPNWVGFNDTDFFPRQPLNWSFTGGVCASAPSGCNRWTSVERSRASNITTVRTIELNDAGEPLHWMRNVSRSDGRPSWPLHFTFHSFKAGPPTDPTAFDPPAACAGVTVTPAPKETASFGSFLDRLVTLVNTYTQAFFTDVARLQQDYEQEVQAQTRSRQERALQDWNRRHNSTFKLGDLGPDFTGVLVPLTNPNDSSVAQQGSIYKKPYRSLLKEGEHLPDHLDYRNSTLLTMVRNQQHCGACYAFAAAGALEAAVAKATGEKVLFSIKQQVDCGWSFSTGCIGTPLLDNAFEYIAQSGGLMYNRDYPYAPQDELCTLRSAQDPLLPYDPSLSKAPGKIKGYAKVDNDDDAIMEALYSRGPLAVGIYVSDLLRAYSSGILIEPKCATTSQMNHAVLLVGYGTSPEGVDYWILQNSWGEEWGDKGFFKVMRGQLDCNINTAAYYPLLTDEASGASAPAPGLNTMAAAAAPTGAQAAAPSPIPAS